MRETYELEGVPLVIDFVPRVRPQALRRLTAGAARTSSRLPAMPTSKPLAEGEYLFTSESVTEGHPDKVADQISDGVLDAIMAGDPGGRVACETLVNTGMAVVSGEISTDVHLNIPEIVRETVREHRLRPRRLRLPLRPHLGPRSRSTSSRPTSPRASTRPTRPRSTRPTTTSSTSPARATRG